MGEAEVTCCYIDIFFDMWMCIDLAVNDGSVVDLKQKLWELGWMPTRK